MVALGFELNFQQEAIRLHSPRDRKDGIWIAS